MTISNELRMNNHPTAQAANEQTPEGTIFEMVPINKLFLDSAYGRATSDRNLERLRSGWNILKMGTLYASLRSDGRYAVIDGWHRKLIAAEQGATHLPCYVYLDLTIAGEAALYEAFGTVFTQSQLVKFRARLVAGEPLAVDIDRTVHEAGMRIDYTSHAPASDRHPEHLKGIVVLESLYRSYGRDHLIRVLRTAAGWFPEDGRARKETVLRAISSFLVQYDSAESTPRVDLKLMRERCLTVGFLPILRSAESISSEQRLARVAGFGRALRAIYNKPMRVGNPRILAAWVDRHVTPAFTTAMTDSARGAKISHAKKLHWQNSPPHIKRAVWTEAEIAARAD